MYPENGCKSREKIRDCTHQRGRSLPQTHIIGPSQTDEAPEKADERSSGRQMEQGAKRLPAHSTSIPAGREAERAESFASHVQHSSSLKRDKEH